MVIECDGRDYWVEYVLRYGKESYGGVLLKTRDVEITDVEMFDEEKGEYVPYPEALENFRLKEVFEAEILKRRNDE